MISKSLILFLYFYFILFRVEFSSFARAIAGAWYASSTMFHCFFLKEQGADHYNLLMGVTP
jgi:hypothetical protein